MDPDGIFLAANEGMAKRFNTTVKDLIGTSAYDFLPADVAKLRAEIVNQAISTREPVRFEDEREGRFFDNQFYPVFDEKDNLVSLAVYSLETTERKKMEEDLKTSQERFILAQTVGRLGIFERELKTGTGWWSDEIFRILGVSPGEYDCSHQAFLSFVHPEDREHQSLRSHKHFKSRPVQYGFPYHLP